ncbi:MAG: alginate export family protein [Legionellaceae bacterium]|nr:alginate export family protein [Legionellaceae bacterium]
MASDYRQIIYPSYLFTDDLYPVSEVPLAGYYETPGYYGRRDHLFPTWMTLGGSIRNRLEYLDGQFRRGLRAVDRQWPIRTRVLFSVHDRFDPLRFTFEYQDARAYLTRAGSNAGTSQIDQNEIQQVHVDWYSPNWMDTGLVSDLQFGRVNMDLGLGRWIARNNFRNSTNAYDGVYWKLGNHPGKLMSHVFAVYPSDIRLKSLNPFFRNNENFMSGAYLLLPRLQSGFPLRMEVNGLHHHHRTGPFQNFTMLGLRTFKEEKIDSWFYDMELQYQFGHIAANVNHAHFFHIDYGYSFRSTWNPQLSALFDYASEGFDILYGRRSFELAPTGILGPFQRSNLVSGGYSILFNPSERFNLYLKHRFSQLKNARFPWVGTGLVNPLGTSGKTLGQSVELRGYWLLYPNLLLEAGYFYFDYGRFPKTAPFTPVTKNTHYLFSQIEWVL